MQGVTLTLIGLQFDGRAPLGSEGRGIVCLGCNLHVEDCSFSSCATVDSGGAIAVAHYQMTPAYYEFIGNTFENSGAYITGGAIFFNIWLFSRITIEMRNNFFENNIAFQGPGIDLSFSIGVENISLLVEGNTFIQSFRPATNGVQPMFSVSIYSGTLQNLYTEFRNNAWTSAVDAFRWGTSWPPGTRIANSNSTLIIDGDSFSLQGGTAINIDYSSSASSFEKDSGVNIVGCRHIFRNLLLSEATVSIGLLPDQPAPGDHGNRAWHYTSFPTIFEHVTVVSDSLNTFAVVHMGGKVEFRDCVFNISASSGMVVLSGESTSAKFERCFFWSEVAATYPFILSYAGGALVLRDSTFLGTGFKMEHQFISVLQASEYEAGNVTMQCAMGSQGMETYSVDVVYMAPWGKVYVTTEQERCVSCGLAEYNLVGGSTINGQWQGGCSTCPEFMDCSSYDGIFAQQGYFCYNDTWGNVQCTTCPEGYCDTSDQWLPWLATCLDSRGGMLCGECSEGYTETLGMDGCVADTKCQEQLGWFYPAVILVGVLWVLFLVWFPVNDNPLWKSLVYFMQMVPVIMVSHDFEILQTILGIFQLDISVIGLQMNACPFVGMEAIHKLMMDYVVPVALLVILGGLAIFHYVLRSIWACCKRSRVYVPIPLDDRDCKESSMHSFSDSLHFHEDLLLHVSEDEDEEDEERDGEKEVISPARKAMMETWYWRYGEAFMGGILMMYEGVTTATMQLLNCVSVNDELRIFRAGSHTCFEPWQQALFAVLACLAVFPLVLLLIRPLKKRYPRSVFIQSMAEVLYKPYRKKKVWWWESYSVLRRLLLVTVSVFVVNPMWKHVGLFLFSWLFLLISLAVNPFRERAYGRFETFFLVLLVGLTFMTTPESMKYITGSDKNWLGGIQTAFTVVPLGISLLAPLYLLRKKIKAAFVWVLQWMLNFAAWCTSLVQFDNFYH